MRLLDESFSDKRHKEFMGLKNTTVQYPQTQQLNTGAFEGREATDYQILPILTITIVP